MNELSYILLIDDEEDLLDLHEAVIQRYFKGRIELCSSGRKALLRVQELGDPAIVVTDHMMPDGDGHFVYEELMKRQTRCRFILCSGASSETLSSLFPGAVAILEKPNTLRGLEAVIPKLLLEI